MKLQVQSFKHIYTGAPTEFTAFQSCWLLTELSNRKELVYARPFKNTATKTCTSVSLSSAENGAFIMARAVCFLTCGLECEVIVKVSTVTVDFAAEADVEIFLQDRRNQQGTLQNKAICHISLTLRKEGKTSQAWFFTNNRNRWEIDKLGKKIEFKCI